MPDELGILHADADAFFASVERRDRPELRGRPLVVGTWVVMAATYDARAYGVRSGITTREARRLCPEVAIVEPRTTGYARASRELFALFRRTAPLVEAVSTEEAFLDVGGLSRPAERIAVELRRAAREQVGLPISVGVARGKTLAKMASRAAKPDGLRVVRPADEDAFLRPLPIDELWGVGPATARKLHARGLTTVGQVADRPARELMALLGASAGSELHAVCSNRDRRALRAERPRRSFGSQRTMRWPAPSAAAVDQVLAELAERVTARMRAAGRAGRGVTLNLRFADFTRLARSRALRRATAAPDTVFAAVRALAAGARADMERRGLTLLGLTVNQLEPEPAPGQLELPLAAGGGWYVSALAHPTGTRTLCLSSSRG